MQLPDGRLIEGPLVAELAEDGTLLSYHLLQHEEAGTEWIGGCLSLTVAAPERK
jgi:hypothetical protein